MVDLDKRISSLIPKQLPGHIQDDYETFTSFLKAYFEWMENSTIKFSYTNNETFQIGETIIGFDTHARAKITSIDATNKILTVYPITNTLFRIGELISGDLSGAIGLLNEFKNNAVSASRKYFKLKDIDKTLDEFVDNFRKEFALNISQKAKVNPRLFYKYIKDFYQSRGNENSYRFLFNILYEKDIDFYYPDKDIFRPSDNHWVRYFVMRVNPNTITNFTGREIKGQQSGATATVDFEQFKLLNGVKIKELYLIESTIKGEFQIQEEIYTTDSGDISTSKLIGMVTDYTINHAGNDYAKDDTIVITSDSSGGVLANIKVDSVTNGYIERIDIVSGGIGYAVNDSLVFDNTNSQGPNFKSAVANVSSVDGSGTITGINISYRGRGYIKIPSITISTSGGSGASLSAHGSEIGAIAKLNIDEPGIHYIRKPTFDLSGSGDGTASITATISPLYIKNVNFENDQSFPSSYKFIQDSYYYQIYSYVIKVDLSLNKWKDEIKKLLHPAGMQLFHIYRVDKIANARSQLPDNTDFLHFDDDLNYIIYFADNDCNEHELIFKTNFGDIFTTLLMDLNLFPYYEIEGFGIISVDLNIDEGPENTESVDIFT